MTQKQATHAEARKPSRQVNWQIKKRLLGLCCRCGQRPVAILKFSYGQRFSSQCEVCLKKSGAGKNVVKPEHRIPSAHHGRN